MKPLFTLIYLCLSVICFSQITDLLTLPTYDCSLKKVMSILGRQTIIFSPADSTGLDAIISDYCSIFGNNCIKKKQAALTTGDFDKDILTVGILSDYNNWSKLTESIKKIGHGFIINNTLFTDKSDGFAYVDTNRIIISGNSMQAVKDAQLAFTGGHDIVVVQNGKITYFGNRKNMVDFNWFNLQLLKETNYIKKSSDLFSGIYVSRAFKDTINYKKLYKDLNVYVQHFTSVYDLRIPAKKVSWFLHANIMEYGTMSGMFGLTCPGNNSAGFSIRGEIHTNGFNIGLLKHEYSHFLYDNNIPQDNNPAFFIEGCVEYITNLDDSSVFNKRLAIAKSFRDTVNYADLVLNNRGSYDTYSEANYAICGVFVKYIIEKFGVGLFKKYCLANNKEAATKEIFHIDFETLISNYKLWLDRQ